MVYTAVSVNMHTYSNPLSGISTLANIKLVSGTQTDEGVSAVWINRGNSSVVYASSPARTRDREVR